MKKIKTAGLYIISLQIILAITSSLAFSWGGVGHRLSTETAAVLIRDEFGGSSLSVWGDLLARHRFELGFYSFLPDSVFRHIDSNQSKTEAPTHFFNLDLLFLKPTTVSLSSFPREFKDARESYQTLENAGSAPWRIRQFLDLAEQELYKVKKPKGGYLRGKTSTGEVKAIFNALYYLGIMSHYSSDALVPHHSTQDWNSWKVGQGGLHFYFEADCVNALEPIISPKVLALAKKMKSTWIKNWRAKLDSQTGFIFNIFFESWTGLPKLLELDKKNSLTKNSDEALGKFALRKPAAIGCIKYEPFLVEQLAKSAVFTSELWKTVIPTGADMSQASNLQFSDIETDIVFIEPKYERLDRKQIFNLPLIGDIH